MKTHAPYLAHISARLISNCIPTRLYLYSQKDRSKYRLNSRNLRKKKDYPITFSEERPILIDSTRR